MTTITSPRLLTKPGEIRDACRRFDIDCDSWEGSYYDMARLEKTLAEDYAELKETADSLVLHVHNATVFVQFLGHGPSGTDLELRERLQMSLLSPKILPRKFRGIAETRHRGEDPMIAAKRALEEEPGYSEPGFKDSWNYYLYYIRPTVLEKPSSEKWHGLPVCYHKEIFGCEINSRIYVEHGYYEVQSNGKGPEKVTYFDWIPISLAACIERTPP
ncbi:hypothetical protein KGP36_05570 [Patescibacteria group bacterium]|nr:hypothetical protein [Patescibacteria group bacterium]MDE1940708.1 hypothetical protein [Patescibacteria group bacterium]